MIKQNPNIQRLSPASIFPEVAAIIDEFKKNNPSASLISLSVGDTSQPLPAPIVEAIKKKADALASHSGYTGYGPECGERPLRKKIAEVIYEGKFSDDEIFVSDGAKCDVGRLQVLFGNHVSIAVQDPSYPFYVDTSHLMGQKELHYLPCHPQNGFFPDFRKSDLLFFCSPNNPTGVAATHEELSNLVALAKRNRTLIVYDAAYSHFIADSNHPRSIYEIEGAKEVAIELGSFSKIMGFTGVRLGWSVVPHELKYENGKSINADWTRVVISLFNGPSNLSQAGGIAALSEIGQKQILQLASFYMENARLLKTALQERGFIVYGGESCPYLWVDTGEKNSWEFFHDFLNIAHLITLPGCGFGPSGEGFVRMSAFGKREEILEAIRRIELYAKSDCNKTYCRS